MNFLKCEEVDMCLAFVYESVDMEGFVSTWIWLSKPLILGNWYISRTWMLGRAVYLCPNVTKAKVELNLSLTFFHTSLPTHFLFY